MTSGTNYGGSPGSEGCCVVKKSYNIPGQDEPVLVDHTNEL